MPDVRPAVRSCVLLLLVCGLFPWPAVEASSLATPSVSAATRYAGRTESWTFQFTPLNAVPARGDVRVVFPVGFRNSPGPGVTCQFLAPTNIASQVAFVDSPTTVRCELGEGGTLAKNVAVQLVFAGIRNPVQAGRVAPFTIETRDDNDAVIDSYVDAAAPNDKLKVDILPEAILDVGVTAPQQRTSLIETHTVTFHVLNAVAQWGEINVTVPDTSATSAGASSVCDITAPATVLAESTYVEGRSVHCQLGGGDAIAAGAGVSLTITKIRNPPTAGVGPSWTVQTRNVSGAAKGGIMEESTADHENVLPNFLSAASIGVTSAVAGVVGTITVQGTPYSAVPNRGDVRIVLPAGYRTSVGGTTVCDVTAPATVHAETTKIVGTSEIDCELGASDSVAAGAPISLTLSRIGNPTSARASTGPFVVQTRNAADAVQDENSTGSMAITANALTNVAVSAPQQKVGATEEWTFKFRPANTLATQGDVRILFPAGFQLSTGGGSTCAYAVGGTGTATSQVVSLTEFVCSGVSLVAGADATLKITNVRNPTTAGLTGTFTIEARNATDAKQDAFTGQAATIVVAPLPGLKVTAAAKTAGTVENHTIEFTTSRAVPVSGDVRIVLPANYTASVGGATVCRFTTPGNLTTTSTTTVTAPSTVICNLPANASIPAGTAVKAVLTKVQEPPVAGVTAAFLVETRNAADAALETNATLRVTIAPHAFAAGPTHNGSAVARNVGDHVFGVTLANPWEGTGALRIDLPDEYRFDGAGSGSTKATFTTGGSGTFAPPSIDNGTAIFVRSGGSVLQAGAVFKVKITNVKTGNATTDGGTFHLETQDAGENIHDMGDVDGPALTAGSATTSAAKTTTAKVTPTKTSRVPVSSSGPNKKTPGPEAFLVAAAAFGMASSLRRRRR